MIHCIKTGFYAKLFHGYVYGDAFAVGNVSQYFTTFEKQEAFIQPQCDLLLRVVAWSRETPAQVQFELNGWSIWFDEQRAQGGAEGGGWKTWSPPSTLISNPGHWIWHGYNGKAI